MSSQQRAWEREYQQPMFYTGDDSKPQADVLRFLKWLRKEGVLHTDLMHTALERGLRVLDLGCGTGRNVRFIIGKVGGEGFGYDFSETAIRLAKERAVGMPIHFEVRTIGELFPIDDNSIDLVLDVTASNALYEAERDTYLREVHRVLHPDGLFFVRTLTTDGDKNARNLVSMFPGAEDDTYILPDVGLQEKVFSEKAFRARYGQRFDIIELFKNNGYQRWGEQSYKRRYIVGYLRKKL